MLDHDENRRLEALADQLWRMDPKFAAALGRGKPCAPREYRRRRWTVLALVTVAVVVPALVVHPLLGFLAGVVTAAAGFVWYGTGLDRS